MSRTDGGRRFGSGRVVPRRLVEKGSRIYVVCCIHGGSTLFWSYSEGSGRTTTVEYRTVSGRVVYYRENVITWGHFLLGSVPSRRKVVTILCDLEGGPALCGVRWSFSTHFLREFLGRNNILRCSLKLGVLLVSHEHPECILVIRR